MRSCSTFLIIGIVCVGACNSDTRKVERAATWLCKYGQLDEPSLDELPPEENLADYVYADDVHYLQSRQEENNTKAGPFGGIAEAMRLAVIPAARAVVKARVQYTKCEVTVEMTGEEATANIKRSVPKLEGGGMGRIRELNELDSHDAKVKRAANWFAESTTTETEEHSTLFVKTEAGWRARFDLEKRAEDERRAEEQRVNEARRVEVQSEIAGLETQLEQFQKARQNLARFEIVSARFIQRERRYSTHRQPVIMLNVRNGMAQAISHAYFRGIVRSPGRAVPWIDENFNYRIPGGLEPGEQVEWGLEPNMFSEWGNVRVPDDAAFTVEVVRLDGAEGSEIYSVMLEEGTEERLQELRNQLSAI